jgi:hypothetical protein
MLTYPLAIRQAIRFALSQSRATHEPQMGSLTYISPDVNSLGPAEGRLGQAALNGM